jgi:Flp pilus assembly protein TadG
VTVVGRERGSAPVELVLITPVLIVVLLLVVLAGRVTQARAEVDEAARDAARAASLARTPFAARADGLSAAQATLSSGSVRCRQLIVTVDTGAFAPGGSIAATVTCTTDLSDLSLLAVPGSKHLTSHFIEPVDLYRGAGT